MKKDEKDHQVSKKQPVGDRGAVRRCGVDRRIDVAGVVCHGRFCVPDFNVTFIAGFKEPAYFEQKNGRQAMNDLENARKEARSMVPGEIMSGLITIGREETPCDTYIYYKRPDTGEYFYQSLSTERFEKEMQEKRKERKRCLEEERRKKRLQDYPKV